MNSARKKMLDRIRAMLNTEGRTEAEMMAFLAKARELMATYEINEAQLQEEAEKATIYKTAAQDPYEIKRGLSVNVGKFTRCKAFIDRDGLITFAGKESDIIFAKWLLDTLQHFIMRALREYQKQRSLKGMTNSNYTSVSFVRGCTSRINEKLKILAPVDWAKSHELILKELNIVVSKERSSKFEVNSAAMAGHAAGNHARFDRPVESGGRRMLK